MSGIAEAEDMKANDEFAISSTTYCNTVRCG